MSKSHEHVYRCQDCDEIGTVPTEPHYDLEEYKRLAPEVKKIIQEEGRVPTEPPKHKLKGYFSDDNPNKALNDKFNEIDPDGKMANDLLQRRFSVPTPDQEQSSNFVQVMPSEDEVCPNCLDKGEYQVTITSTGVAGKNKYTVRCYCGRSQPTSGQDLVQDRVQVESKLGQPPSETSKPAPLDDVSGGR